MIVLSFCAGVASLVLLRELISWLPDEPSTTDFNKQVQKWEALTRKYGTDGLPMLGPKEDLYEAYWDYRNSLACKLANLDYQAEQVIADCTARMATKFNKQYVQAWAKVSKLTLVK